MKSLIQKGITLGLGLAIMSKEQVEKFVAELVEKGDVPFSESKNLINEIMDKGEKRQQLFEVQIREKIKEALSDFEIATKHDLKQLEERIKNLENQGKINE